MGEVFWDPSYRVFASLCVICVGNKKEFAYKLVFVDEICRGGGTRRIRLLDDSALWEDFGGRGRHQKKISPVCSVASRYSDVIFGRPKPASCLIAVVPGPPVSWRRLVLNGRRPWPPPGWRPLYLVVVAAILEGYILPLVMLKKKG